ncbi:hypothetical protein B0H21DRAFT_828142 [Amylocystis lapponica]|nr:hypothetical protein B0H21DRAFT_828142 [Amylocystis lapponica]
MHITPTHYIPPPDIRLTSLDPPEIDRGKLPQAMKRMAWRVEEMTPLSKAPVYDTLPRALIPSRKRKYKPPLMLYGWPVNFDCLLRIAGARDQLYFENIVDLVGDLDGPAEDIQEVISQELDRSLTVECLVRALGKELSPCPPKGLKLWIAINHPNLVIISIYSNYDLVKPTSDKFVEQLRVALGEEERPRWYLNDELCYWRRHGSSI